MSFRHWVIAAGVAALSGATALDAHAQIADFTGEESYPAPEPTERGGFMVGLGFGYGYGSAAGYPNKVTEIGVPEYRAEVGGLGNTLSIWLGGALRDWVTFGIGISTASALEQNKTAGGASIGVRLEGYPFFVLSTPGGFFRNLGFALEAGAGTAAIVPNKDQKHPLAVGGGMANLGFGAFWEPLKFWHIAVGPALQYTHAWSETMHSNVVTLGVRSAFYWTRPKAPPAKAAYESSSALQHY